MSLPFSSECACAFLSTKQNYLLPQSYRILMDSHTSSKNDKHPLKLFDISLFYQQFYKKEIFYDIFTSLYSLIWNICSRVRKIDRCDMLLLRYISNHIQWHCEKMRMADTLIDFPSSQNCILCVHKCVAATFFGSIERLWEKRSEIQMTFFIEK